MYATASATDKLYYNDASYKKIGVAFLEIYNRNEERWRLCENKERGHKIYFREWCWDWWFFCVNGANDKQKCL